MNLNGNIKLILLLLLISTLSGCPTKEPAPEHAEKARLVEIAKLDSTILIDIRYATPNNFQR